MYDKVIHALKNAEKIAIFMHINPDGDCISSALALYTFLTKLGKNAAVFAPEDLNNLPVKMAILKNFDKLTPSQGVQASFDLAIAVDAAGFNRLSDDNARIFINAKKKVVIDHHVSHAEYGNITLLNENASSTAEIVYILLKRWDASVIDKDIATLIFTGIVTDTGCFAYSSVSSETFMIASELLEYGVDNAEIVRKIEKSRTLPVFNLTHRVLSGIKFFHNGEIAIIFFKSSDFIATGTTEYDTEGIINSALNINGVELAISIAQVKEKSFKVSFRSKERLDVSKLAACFGGGGHVRAAGCRINGYAEDVYNKVIEAASEMLEYA